MTDPRKADLELEDALHQAHDIIADALDGDCCEDEHDDNTDPGEQD